MRSIKFRGKRKDNGKWAYGYYVQRSHKDCCVYHYIYTGGYEEEEAQEGTEIEFYEVIPETVGQSTGLLDKDGTELCAGDICKHYLTDALYVIEWNNELAGFQAVCYIGGERINSFSYSWPNLCSSKDLIRIGSIHETPELLEARE